MTEYMKILKSLTIPVPLESGINVIIQFTQVMKEGKKDLFDHMNRYMEVIKEDIENLRSFDPKANITEFTTIQLSFLIKDDFLIFLLSKISDPNIQNAINSYIAQLEEGIAIINVQTKAFEERIYA